MKYCADLEKEPGFPGCCGSCHEDADCGRYDLGEVYDGDKQTHSVCCKVYEWVMSAEGKTGVTK